MSVIECLPDSAMHQLPSNDLCKIYCLIYLDDLIVFSQTAEGHCTDYK